jgi:uncharacterized protein (DUF1697 family)
MAHVVLLRGVNVGGHRTFRPTVLCAQLEHLDVVNIGAAGNFVVRAPIARAELRAEFARRLPFETEIVICMGREIARIAAHDRFADERPSPDIVRFVSVLSRAPRRAPTTSVTLPPRGRWMLRILAVEGRFVFGLYRRQMKAIGYLGALDDRFGVPVTTRSWSTITAIARVLANTKP